VNRYAKFTIPALIVVAVIVGLLFMLNSNLVYFHTPSEIISGEFAAAERVRLGGQVVGGTVSETVEGVTFEVTDGVEAITVIHQGAPQQLFQEGIGVVVEGTWTDGAFHSDTMMVKHDEQYRSDEGEYHTPEENG
jgi:cytochrome c-type biogenesis protein CcmE